MCKFIINESVITSYEYNNNYVSVSFVLNAHSKLFLFKKSTLRYNKKWIYTKTTNSFTCTFFKN